MSVALDFQVSDHFRSIDFCVSASHPELVKDVPDFLRPNMIELIVCTLQPLRNFAKSAISISSGYRSQVLNAAVDGSLTSQHLFAEAADVYAKKLMPKELFALVRKHANALVIGQIILYPTFVHVALPCSKYRKPAYFEVVAGKLRLV